MAKRPPIDELIDFIRASLAGARIGTTTTIGNVGGTTFTDAALAGAGANSFVSMCAVIAPDELLTIDSSDITAFNTATGEITLNKAYKGGQIPVGTRYAIITYRFVPAEVAAVLAVVIAINTKVGILDLTQFIQEAAGATVVTGTTWADLLDQSTITKPTEICGFMVTLGGAWAGNPQVRITDGTGNKIWPFQDEYEMTVDFADASQVVFNFPVVVPIADGYKFQFRSTNAADGAGETLALNNLDVIERG